MSGPRWSLIARVLVPLIFGLALLSILERCSDGGAPRPCLGR